MTGGNQESRINNQEWSAVLSSLAEPLRRVQLALCRLEASLAVVHIGQYIVSERRDLRIGLRQEPLAGPLLGANQIPGVEERLGQVQVTCSEIRRMLGRLAEQREGLGGPSLPLEQLGQVERRAKGGSALLQLTPIGGDRLLN